MKKNIDALAVLSPERIQQGGNYYEDAVGYWEQLMRSGVLPRAVNNAQTCILMAEAGAVYGWTPIQSVGNFTVIEGQLAMKAAAMWGLILDNARKNGYKARPVQRTIEGAAIEVIRQDTFGDEPVRYEFTQDDAMRADLWEMKSKAGKPLPWSKYPKTMMFWRVVSIVAREAFSDLFVTVRHSAEELRDEAEYHVTQLEEDAQAADVGPTTLEELASEDEHPQEEPEEYPEPDGGDDPAPDGGDDPAPDGGTDPNPEDQ